MNIFSVLNEAVVVLEKFLLFGLKFLSSKNFCVKSVIYWVKSGFSASGLTKCYTKKPLITLTYNQCDKFFCCLITLNLFHEDWLIGQYDKLSLLCENEINGFKNLTLLGFFKIFFIFFDYEIMLSGRTKTLRSPSTSLHPGIKMGTGELSGNPVLGLTSRWIGRCFF